MHIPAQISVVGRRRGSILTMRISGAASFRGAQSVGANQTGWTPREVGRNEYDQIASPESSIGTSNRICAKARCDMRPKTPCINVNSCRYCGADETPHQTYGDVVIFGQYFDPRRRMPRLSGAVFGNRFAELSRRQKSSARFPISFGRRRSWGVKAAVQSMVSPKRHLLEHNRRSWPMIRIAP